MHAWRFPLSFIFTNDSNSNLKPLMLPVVFFHRSVPVALLSICYHLVPWVCVDVPGSADHTSCCLSLSLCIYICTNINIYIYMWFCCISLYVYLIYIYVPLLHDRWLTPDEATTNLGRLYVHGGYVMYGLYVRMYVLEYSRYVQYVQYVQYAQYVLYNMYSM